MKIPATPIRIIGPLALLFVFCAAAGAAEIPGLTMPDGAGVNIHFIRGHEQDLDMISAAGFKFVRMDFFWTETEKTRGVYDWSGYDELTDNLEKRGLRPYYIFDYSNPLYEEMVKGQGGTVLASPRHPESVAAFARWTAAAAKHYQGRHVIWEIWNEPNGGFWQPEPNVAEYTTLALAAARAVRAAAPSATIVAPASSGFPWPYLEQFLQSGVLEYLDGISVHPYRSPNTPPETAATDYQKLRDLIDKNTPAGKKSIPIISGEWGYSSCVDGVSSETQARFIARQQLSNLMNGIPISIWYDWKNDGEDPKENEHNFGTVLPNLEPKPAYVAIKTLTHELAGFSIKARMPASSPDDFVLIMTNGIGETRLAAWTLGAPHLFTLQVRRGGGSVPIVDSQGSTSQAAVRARQIVLTLDGGPKYIALGRVHLK
ncbi:MAG TPA: cellulase family glycosylhydrolase [Candidatus Saccharimonadales bacterium]|nr:cellulase family glycosylhydrolase [Candidatus Saccharimonadales bacterium]